MINVVSCFSNLLAFSLSLSFFLKPTHSDTRAHAHTRAHLHNHNHTHAISNWAQTRAYMNKLTRRVKMKSWKWLAPYLICDPHQAHTPILFVASAAKFWKIILPAGWRVRFWVISDLVWTEWISQKVSVKVHIDSPGQWWRRQEYITTRCLPVSVSCLLLSEEVSRVLVTAGSIVTSHGYTAGRITMQVCSPAAAPQVGGASLAAISTCRTRKWTCSAQLHIIAQNIAGWRWHKRVTIMGHTYSTGPPGRLLAHWYAPLSSTTSDFEREIWQSLTLRNPRWQPQLGPSRAPHFMTREDLMF